LNATIGITGHATLQYDSEITQLIDTISIGANNFDSLEYTITHGASGALKCNEWFRDERTVAASTADNLDLAGSLKNPFGDTITFTYLRVVILAIDAPDGTKALRFGPRGQANAWQGPFAGTSATDYITVTDSLFLANLSGTNGWPVTAGTGDILGIYNPGTSAVTYRIWLLGQV
jgi:hypothetical protein